jgi:predicted ATPase
MYFLVVFDSAGASHPIGSVKIGEFGMKPDQRRPEIPNEFTQLGERFFSLGQDDSYYKNLNDLGATLRESTLRALRDVAFDVPLFERAREERVTGISLLRSVPLATVTGQFRRLARGGARLTQYAFNYRTPISTRPRTESVTLDFSVQPESQPPTNIHVLIGRNGVGKTYLLNSMTSAIIGRPKPENADFGEFLTGDDNGTFPFSNLVSVSFSAFDTFEPVATPKDRSTGLQYSYIGLKRIGRSARGKPFGPKSPSTLAREFSDSVRVCRQGARAARWKRALEALEADPIFKDSGVAELATRGPEGELQKRTANVYRKLSSGHKIVLLTVTRLVETVEEKTLVLLDEPEAHLHPPLLAAFVRALSDLLFNRNGVAIIATHSPVVLQEVPKSCAWKIRRSGVVLRCERPEIETFGENVGVLTREVFGLEVTQTGFHKLLADAVTHNGDFESVVGSFSGELGVEAKAIIRGLIAARQRPTS